jgi:hypothetical protein
MFQLSPLDLGMKRGGRGSGDGATDRAHPGGSEVRKAHLSPRVAKGGHFVTYSTHGGVLVVREISHGCLHAPQPAIVIDDLSAAVSEIFQGCISPTAVVLLAGSFQRAAFHANVAAGAGVRTSGKAAHSIAVAIVVAVVIATIGVIIAIMAVRVTTTLVVATAVIIAAILIVTPILQVGSLQTGCLGQGLGGGRRRPPAKQT